MKAHVVLDASTTINLLGAGKIDLLRKLFGSVVLPSRVQKQLLEGQTSRVWAANPPEWVTVAEPQQIDPAIIEFHRTRIGEGEAAAISLAKEIAAREGRPTCVLSDEWSVRDFLNSEGKQQRVFATNFWSVICHGAERGWVDLERERPQLERCNSPGRSMAAKLDLFQRFLERSVNAEAIQPLALSDGRVPTPDQIRSAKYNRALGEADGHHSSIPLESSIAVVMDYDENGGAEAVRADIDLAKRLAAEQGRSWIQVSLELGKAEVEARWKMAHEIAQRTGRRPADVEYELGLLDDRLKSGKSKSN